jgi:GT2 family glycosyltransferase
LDLKFSIIIPVYNRPDELNDLLLSISEQDFIDDFQVIVVEDGSTETSENVVKEFSSKLLITYFFKENSGPGDSRNYGMERANGNYFIILDSDCILPKHYLKEVYKKLQNDFTDAYGGADASDSSFTNIQKTISYAMTSVLTTGGIRGNKNVKKFQPRSFNMGISKQAFKTVKGFSKMNYGEDIDLTLRLWENNFETQFIENAFVYHKRRTNWKSFFKQTFNFGAARPILNILHRGTSKITYWFPSFYIVFVLFSIVAFLLGKTLLLWLLAVYFLLIFIDSLIKNKSLVVAFMSLFSVNVMFFGYGFGFLHSIVRLKLLGQEKEKVFPKMFSKV